MADSLISISGNADGGNDGGEASITPNVVADVGDDGGNESLAIPLSDFDEFKDQESGMYLGKYKDVRGVFEGYKELTGKLREKIPEAPSGDYEFTFEAPELKNVSLADDPLWQDLAPVFKTLNISNAQANSIAETFLKWQLSQVPDLDAEKAKLGSDADTMIKSVEQAVGKYAKTDEDKAAFEYIGRNADSLKLVYNILSMAGEKTVPVSPGGVSSETKAELLQQAFDYKKNNPDFESNPAKQTIYDRMLDKALA
jgi:hypothetical protein